MGRLRNIKRSRDAGPDKPHFEAFGTAVDVMESTDRELMVSGPAGTGKSRACIEKLDLMARMFPESRHLMLRQTRNSLTQTGLVTLQREVLPANSSIKLHTGLQEFRYPNGSVIVVGGLDNPVKVMSAQYDSIYVQEATEIEVTAWEYMLTRLRNGKMPFRQLYGDCNPDAPTHFLMQRSLQLKKEGHPELGSKLRMIYAQHTDNPTLYNYGGKHISTNPTPADGPRRWTESGVEYMEILQSLTGVRRERLYEGKWVMAEGMIYDNFRSDRHLFQGWDPQTWEPVTKLELVNGRTLTRTPPASWHRYVAIDFGYPGAFCLQWWAEDPSGRLYLYREIYKAKTLLEEHCAQFMSIMSRTKDRPPTYIVSDHDAQERAIFEKKTGLKTRPANKDVTNGIQATHARFEVQADGLPRIMMLWDTAVERCGILKQLRLPQCTYEELPGYIWDPKKTDEPQKENDHGSDAMRYVVASRDIPDGGDWQVQKVRR